MSYTHLHLLLNHFPIIGTLIGVVSLMASFYLKKQSVQLVSLWTIVIMAIIAIPVFLTGEPAEDSVENIAGISKNTIEQHEESAEVALWVLCATGVIALASLLAGYMKNQLNRPLAIFTLVAGLISFALMARTGYLGGQIRHTEIVNASTSSDQAIINPGEEENEN